MKAGVGDFPVGSSEDPGRKCRPSKVKLYKGKTKRAARLKGAQQSLKGLSQVRAWVHARAWVS